MPYEYEHIEETILDVTQRGLFNSFIASTWSGSNNNIVRATVTPQAGGAVIVEVTGSKSAATAAQLPDPPVVIIDTDGTSYTYEHTDRAPLTPGQTTQLNTFIASVWPGVTTDVSVLNFQAVQDEAQTWQMRATLYGTLTAVDGSDLPRGKRFKIKNVT